MAISIALFNTWAREAKSECFVEDNVICSHVFFGCHNHL